MPSSNRFIPKEQLSAYQRWEMQSLDGPAPGAERPARPGDAGAATEAAAPAVNLPTAAEIEEIQRQAREEGRAQGYKEGRAAAEAEAARLRSVVQAASAAFQTLDEALQADLLALVLELSRQFLRQTIEVRPEAIVPIIREALASLPQFNQHITVVLNPEDVALVKHFLESELIQTHWRIIEDARMKRGGCRVETSHSDVDATRESRWARLVAALGADDIEFR